MDQPTLGKLITEPVGRDAVHVPVFPAVCDTALRPGGKLRISGGRDPHGNYIVGWLPVDEAAYDAVVDPFLVGTVPPGQPFYAVIRPGAVTGLRHVYTHPAFSPTRPPKEDA